MSYSELESSLRGLPPTWYPALIKCAIEESIAKKVWVKGGATNFVRSLEKEITGHGGHSNAEIKIMAEEIQRLKKEIGEAADIMIKAQGLMDDDEQLLKDCHAAFAELRAYDDTFYGNACQGMAERIAARLGRNR